MEITTDMIKELRAATGAGILDCRKALTEADGDFQKAVDWLREKDRRQAGGPGCLTGYCGTLFAWWWPRGCDGGS